MSNIVPKWFIAEISVPESFELKEEFIINILEENDTKFKIYVNQTIIFDINEKPSDETLEIIKESLFNEVKSSSDENLEDFDFKTHEWEEILFNFTISSKDFTEENFISQLARISDSVIDEYDREEEFLNKVDYAEKHYSRTPLIHNIRCRNIAVFTLKSFPLGFALIGYMKLKDCIKVTIKAFHYDLLKYLIDNFSETFEENIIWEDNINWKWLMSRKVSSGYRESKKHITQNPLMRSFLKVTTIKDDEKESMKFTLDKILSKGYLVESEYQEITSNKNVTKFLQPYRRLVKQNFPEKGIWIDTSSGLVFDEKNQDDPERIKESRKFQTIFAPSQHLLHYIRAYWHQDFVETILRKVQESLNKNSDLFILELVTDFQFDLKRSGDPSQSSRDIDVLIRVENKIDKSEHIVAIEAKRNASEFNSVKKDIETKISHRYINIFSGFIAVAHFEKGKSAETEVELEWGTLPHVSKKPLYLCASSQMHELIEQITKAIGQICGLENE